MRRINLDIEDLVSPKISVYRNISLEDILGEGTEEEYKVINTVNTNLEKVAP